MKTAWLYWAKSFIIKHEHAEHGPWSRLELNIWPKKFYSIIVVKPSHWQEWKLNLAIQKVTFMITVVRTGNSLLFCGQEATIRMQQLIDLLFMCYLIKITEKYILPSILVEWINQGKRDKWDRIKSRVFEKVLKTMKKRKNFADISVDSSLFLSLSYDMSTASSKESNSHSAF